MIRQILAVSALVLLGACSSGGGNNMPIMSAIKDVILPSKDAGGPPQARAPLTRARIEANGLALVRAQIDGEEISNILSAKSLNGLYVTYVSAFQQTIAMKGTLITATRGLGGDLLAVADGRADPVANLTPPDNWPASISRSYRFPDDGPGGRLVSVDCNILRGSEIQITIVEITYDVTAMSETCSGEGEAFTNIHLVDETGQIWQTRQWIGSKLGYLNMEVLEPVTF